MAHTNKEHTQEPTGWHTQNINITSYVLLVVICITMNKQLTDIKNLLCTAGLLCLCFPIITHLQNCISHWIWLAIWETHFYQCSTDRNGVILLCNITEILLQHWCSPVNILHIFRTPFPKNTYGGLTLLIGS